MIIRYGFSSIIFGFYSFILLASLYGKERFLNINVNISSNLLNQNCPNIANNVKVKILENNDNFNEQDWKSLYLLSEKIFVEETESLKKGAAGAGLTDND